jgi:predicted MFS family arabinose efflux permease
MTSATGTADLAHAEHRPTIGANIGPTAMLLFLASIVVSFLAASSAPTPLYAIYQARWGFSPVMTTVVFGVYALAVLASLLTFGKLSDHVGRRPVLLVALAVQSAAMVVFATSDGLDMLVVARVLQGLSTGAALGAVGAGMIDVDPARGATANSVAPGSGSATGALGSALVVQYLPAPTHLIYLLLMAVFVLQAIGVGLMRETVTRNPGAFASMIPDIKLPAQVRQPMTIAAPVLFAVWALAGFYGSLGPELVRTLVHSSSVVFGGLGLFILAGTAAASILVLRKTPARTIMVIGIGSLILGVSTTLLAISLGSPVGFFIGTAIAGIGFGSGFQGGIRLVLPLAQSHERSGVLSLLFVVSYLGMGIPAVIGGVWATDVSGLLTTSREYGIAVIALSLAALVGLIRLSSKHSLELHASGTPVGSSLQATPDPGSGCPSLVLACADAVTTGAMLSRCV